VAQEASAWLTGNRQHSEIKKARATTISAKNKIVIKTTSKY